jgi:preprotein translocase subunit SecE
MARSRQRAKQRQAARREARLAGRQPPPADGSRAREEEEVREEVREQVDLAAGAPPQDAGRADTVLEHPPPHTDAGEDYAEEELEVDEEELAGFEEASSDAVPATRARARRDVAAHRERGKLLSFFANVWAELQRVQWPNRQQLTTLTGVVLGFVLIAGGYLGLLDAIFSRLIKAIL